MCCGVSAVPVHAHLHVVYVECASYSCLACDGPYVVYSVVMHSLVLDLYCIIS